MKRIISLLLTTAFFGVIVLPVSAYAQRVQTTITCQNGQQVTYDEGATSPTQACESAGSTYVFVSATKDPDCYKNNFLNIPGLPHWYEYLEVQKRSNNPQNPNDFQSKGFTCQIVGPTVENGDRLDITQVVVRVSLAILDILMYAAGVVAFVFIVYGGFQFVLSSGDAQKAKTARETILNAAIGLGIAILGAGIVAYIGNTIAK